MPIFEFECQDCGASEEQIIMGQGGPSPCGACGSENMTKLISATSSLTGAENQAMPGPGDHGCCGSKPSQAGCAGPGSCCGKTF